MVGSRGAEAGVELRACTEEMTMCIRRWRPFWLGSHSGDGLPGSGPEGCCPGTGLLCLKNYQLSLGHSRQQTDSTRPLGSLPMPTTCDANYEKEGKQVRQITHVSFPEPLN